MKLTKSDLIALINETIDELGKTPSVKTKKKLKEGTVDPKKLEAFKAAYLAAKAALIDAGGDPGDTDPAGGAIGADTRIHKQDLDIPLITPKRGSGDGSGDGSGEFDGITENKSKVLGKLIRESIQELLAEIRAKKKSRK